MNKTDDLVLEEKDVILCHTPFRDKKMVDRYHDKWVLVSGLGKMIDVA